VEKSKLEKGSLHDRATSLPEQHRLLANRLTESLGLSTMQIRSSRTGRMSRHFSHDLPLSATKPSTRPLSPQGLGRRVVRQFCRGTPQPRICHVLLWQILGQQRLQAHKLLASDHGYLPLSVKLCAHCDVTMHLQGLQSTWGRLLVKYEAESEAISMLY